MNELPRLRTSSVDRSGPALARSWGGEGSCGKLAGPRRFTLYRCLVLGGEKMAPKKRPELCRGGNWISAKEASNSTHQGGPSWDTLEIGYVFLKRQGRGIDSRHWRQPDLFPSSPLTDEAEGTLDQCLLISNQWVMGWVGICAKL